MSAHGSRTLNLTLTLSTKVKPKQKVEKLAYY